MGCQNKRYCIECKSEVAKVVVHDSSTCQVEHVRNWGANNHVVVDLPLKKVRYDPRNRCYYHLKKFLARKETKALIKRRELERR
jgi:hypothetical protein